METSQHRTWQAHAEKRWHARFARDLRRTVIVLSLLALSVYLVYLLFPPFFAAQTHLILLGAKNGDSFNAPAIAFVGEDLDLVGSVEEAKVHDHSDLLRSAQDMKRFSEAIQGDGIGGSDHLVVYVMAHGISVDSKAYLLCNNFELRRPDAGRIDVDQLISEVCQSPAKTKLIVLNAGTIQYDPRLGVVGNDFPRLLEKAVHQANDPSLWVYCSHAPLEYSHASIASRHSVFGMFFGAGMKGAADLDGDRVVTLNEIVAFTSANVSNWVAQSTDRAAQQTPTLIWGGGKQPGPNPTLLSLFDRGGKEPLTVASLIGSTADAESGQATITNSGNAQGLIRRHQVTLTSAKSPTPKSDDKPEAAGDGKLEADPSGGSESGDVATEPPTEGGDAASSEGSAQKDVDTKLALRRMLAGAWKQRDEAAQKWTPADPHRSAGR